MDSKVCEECGKEFIPKKKGSRFCSQECYHKYASKNPKECNRFYKGHSGGTVKTKCYICGKEIIKPYSIYKKAEKHFCSRACLGI